MAHDAMDILHIIAHDLVCYSRPFLLLGVEFLSSLRSAPKGIEKG